MTDSATRCDCFIPGRRITRFKEWGVGGGSAQYPVTIQLRPAQLYNPDVLAVGGAHDGAASKLGQVRLENVASIVPRAGPATFGGTTREFQLTVYANVAACFPLALGARIRCSPSKKLASSRYPTDSRGN